MIIRTNKYSSVIKATVDPEQIAACKRGELVDETGKPILLIRGGEHAAKDATAVIYRRFAQEKDDKNQPFCFSRSGKCICCTGDHGIKRPLTPSEFTGWVKAWFTLAELTTIQGREALNLIQQLSTWNLLTIRQSRYLTLDIAQLFAHWIP